MGVDVIGQNPTSKTGEYFRATWWDWRPLARFACDVAPEITNKCVYWQSNDRDGLENDDATALADKLQATIDSGQAENFAKVQAATDTTYRFSLDGLKRFISFLRDSGGFIID
jgi:hypothetical protein